MAAAAGSGKVAPAVSMATSEGAGRTKACTNRPGLAFVSLQGMLGTRHYARGSCAAAWGPADSNREVVIATAGEVGDGRGDA